MQWWWGGVAKSCLFKFGYTVLFVKLFFFFLIWFHQGSNPGPLHWKHGVLATRPPGKFPAIVILGKKKKNPVKIDLSPFK